MFCYSNISYELNMSLRNNELIINHSKLLSGLPLEEKRRNLIIIEIVSREKHLTRGPLFVKATENRKDT